MTEEVMVTHALRESTCENNSPEIIDLSTNDLLVFVVELVYLGCNSVCSAFFSLPESLDDVIKHMQIIVQAETHEYHVRRNEVFQDLIRETRKRSYSPFKRVKTYL